MLRIVLVVSLVVCSLAYNGAMNPPQFRARATAQVQSSSMVQSKADTFALEQEGAIKDALAQISTDVMATARELKEEAKWVKDVEKILLGYETKVTRVEADIAGSRIALKNLLVKKRQLENMQLQKGLEIKLQDANGDLTLLGQAVTSVDQKEADFNTNVVAVQATIDDLNGQLTILKGKGAPAVKGAAAKL